MEHEERLRLDHVSEKKSPAHRDKILFLGLEVAPGATIGCTLVVEDPSGLSETIVEDGWLVDQLLTLDT